MNRYSRVHAEINLDAILHNLDAMHAVISENTKIMAVIKADGYGHGAVEIAEAIDALPYIWGYAVATVEEGISLRNHGIVKPILILGYVFPEQYEDMIRAAIRPTVFTREMAEELSQAADRLSMDCPIHFAVDTGMSRIGYQVTDEAADEMAQLAALPHIIVEGIFTHFARADEADKTSARGQLALFLQTISMLEHRGIDVPIRHCSNSAGIVELPEANMDLVRAGITMYGLWPSNEVDKSRIDLPVGYADGYARGLSNKGDVLIHGRRAPIRGRVCMDQFMVDVTDIPDVKCGDRVVLIGADGVEQITMEEVGGRSGRFNYEFVCDLGKRIPRVYLRSGEVVGTRDHFSE